MIKFLLAMLVAAIATEASAAPESVKPDAGEQVKKSVFSGNEARLAAFNLVHTDCSSGPLPDYRVVSKPAKGTIRLEPATIPIDRASDSGRAHCNGKEAKALGLYYKAPEGFTGVERVTIDVDWRNGRVNRYIYIEPCTKSAFWKT